MNGPARPPGSGAEQGATGRPASSSGPPDLHWEGELEDRSRARAAAAELAALRAGLVGEPLTLGNEFSEIRVSLVRTRNGARLLVEAIQSGQWVTLDPLELEALTWQGPATFSAMVGHPFAPLFPDQDETGRHDTAGRDDAAAAGS